MIYNILMALVIMLQQMIEIPLNVLTEIINIITNFIMTLIPQQQENNNNNNEYPEPTEVKGFRKDDE